MPNQNLSLLDSATPAAGDLAYIVDVSDLTHGIGNGSPKKTTLGDIVALGSGTYQPLDSDLTAIAALSTTAFGRALLELLDAAAARTALDAAGLSLSQTFTAQQTFQAPTSGVAAVFKAAGTTPGNIANFTNSSGSVLASVSSDAALWTMPFGFAIGQGASANAASSTAIGRLTNASGASSVAMGVSSSATGLFSTAIGNGANASGDNSIAIGFIAQATGPGGVAIGNQVNNSFNASAAFCGATVFADLELVFGSINGTGSSGNFRLTGFSSTSRRSLFQIATEWVDSTDATNKARAIFRVNDSANLVTGVECMRIESGGSAPKIGFLGANAVVRQANASQAAIDAILDPNAKSAIQALYDLLVTNGLANATA